MGLLSVNKAAGTRVISGVLQRHVVTSLMIRAFLTRRYLSMGMLQHKNSQKTPEQQTNLY